MAVTECLARGFDFELNTGGGTWVAVEGINTWSHAPQANDADVTTFDDEGRMAHLKASRGDQFTLNGLYQEDPDTGARAAGQLAVEEWAQEIGPESIKNFRVTSPGGVEREFACSATVTSGGGGNDDPNAWSVAIMVSGAVTRSDAAALPSAPTSISGTNGNAHSVISFTATGTEFEVVVYAAGDEVARVRSSAKPVYVGGLTNGTAYTAKVRARNAAGWSALSVASSAFTPAP